MASTVPLVDDTTMDYHELNHGTEASTAYSVAKRAWISFSFIAVTVMGFGIAGSGCVANLIVYLMERFNMKGIHATQISNIVNGSSYFLPIVAAIIADSFLGNFVTIWVSSFVSLLGLFLLTLTATLDSLRPPHCELGLETCEAPSTFQLAVLYSAIILVSIGMGGSKFTIATMGANQFDKAREQESFFNWLYVITYLAAVTGITAIVFLEDNVGWVLGFTLCLIFNAIGLAVFISGKGYYRLIKPHGSPFTGLARVILASIRKKKVFLSFETEDYYYYGCIGESKLQVLGPTSSFRFLNRAAIITKGDIQLNGQPTESWSLCTVQQVEDFKTLIKTFPLWSTGIFVSVPVGMQSSLMVLQALTMDRHLTRQINIPAGTFLVFTLLSTAISLTLFDYVIFPLSQKFTSHYMTPLQRIGIGHVLNILGMVGSALVEVKRLHVVRSHSLGQIPLVVLAKLCIFQARWLYIIKNFRLHLKVVLLQ